MIKQYKLSYLSSEFFSKYSPNKYPEIENKPTRPYLVMLVKIDNNTFAIPFRTNVKHKFCYRFKNSNRDTKSVTGLDYTKAVIVNNDDYIGDDAIIDNKEYIELNNKYYFIISKFKKYVDGYYKYVHNELNEFEARKYKYSTLKYFHAELGIE